MSADEPIRVLHVFASLERGGAETAIMTYYRRMDRSRIQFDFVVHTPDPGAYEEEVLALGGRIYRLPRARWNNVPAYRRAWRELLKNNPGYSAVHGHFFTISALYLPVARHFGVKTIAHSHADVPGLRGKVVRLVNLSVSRVADIKAACSEEAARYFYGTKAVERGEVIIINNAIELERFRFDPVARARMRSALGLDQKFVIGHVGRFEYSKNHVFLLDVFAELRGAEPMAVLLLVGDGSLRPQIESRISSVGQTEHVILAGVRSDIPDMLQAMDVFVVPSLYEGLGIVAVESQAAGLATIVSDRLPREAHVTDLIESLPLEAGVHAWSSAILEKRGREGGVSPMEEIAAAGFDIECEAGKLERLYLDLAEGRRL